jgi:hypothetical protein
MKSFLNNLSLVTLGILISAITMTYLPSQIRAVTASLSTTVIKPYDSPTAAIAQFPESRSLLTTAIPFSLPATTLHNNGLPMQMDMNGDGLMDFIFSHIYTSGSSQYVLLNNGQGFDTAYICNRKYDTNTRLTTYRGHCADPNNAL